MATPNEEAQRLIATSGRTQVEVAVDLTRELGREIRHYTVSRISSGERKPKADEMDALRRLYGGGVAEPPQPYRASYHLTDSPELIPLYGAAGTPRGGLRLSEGNMVGVSPMHPAQRGALEPFNFLVPDNRLADRLCRGETAHALRNRPPYMSGQLCLVELTSGEATPYVYEREDDRTLFVKVRQPKETVVTIPLKDVAALHLIVAVTFGPN